jgi:hypothetical protein
MRSSYASRTRSAPTVPRNWARTRSAPTLLQRNWARSPNFAPTFTPSHFSAAACLLSRKTSKEVASLVRFWIVLKARGLGSWVRNLARDESEEAKAKSEQRSVAAIAEPDFSYDVFGEINAKYEPAAAAAPVTNSSETRIEQRDLKEDEITAVRAFLERLSRNVFAELRALPGFLVASDCDAIRALTPDEIAAAKAAFPGVDMEAVAKRVANSVRARHDDEQEVDASVCVGGIEFLERCVQGAARAVAAMARVSAKSAQPSGRIDADDDDGDVDDGGFGKQKLYPDRK